MQGLGVLPAGVAVDEAADDAAAELLLEVEGEVRDAERVRERAGAEHRLGRAAGLGAVGLGIGPELDRDADHLRPALALEQRGDGAVDAAGHGDGDALAGRSAPASDARPRRRRACARRAVQGVGGELRGVALGGRQAADRRVDRRRSPIRAASSTGAPSTISATAAVAARVAPQPSASKRDARRSGRPRSTSEIRERSPQAAPPAAPVKAPSAAGPRRLSSRR